MSLQLLIAINVLADAALIGGLAYVMSHAARLTPHVASVPDARMTSSASPGSPSRELADRSARAQTARGRTPVAQRTGAQRSGAHTTAVANANR